MVLKAYRERQTEISRNDKGHYVGQWDGKQINFPSVTTALKMLSDFSKVNAFDLEKAAKFGTAVHTLVELYETNRLKRETLAPILEALLKAWERCKVDHSIKVLRVETPIASMRYRYAGRLDVIAEVRGVPSFLRSNASGRRNVNVLPV